MLQGCAWSNTDKALWTGYTVSHAIDIVQTREILSNDKYYERNPILKNMTPNEATAAMLAFYGGAYFVADKFPKYRTLMIVLLTAVSIVCITNNFSIGVKF